jgi:hypothetical protein
MAQGISYDILPKLPLLPAGTLLKNRDTLHGNLAAGINEKDDNFEFGGDEEIEIPQHSNLMFVEDVQFMAVSKEKPMSAWIRCHLIHEQPKRLWDFETFRGKKRILQDKIEELFEVLKLGGE